MKQTCQSCGRILDKFGRKFPPKSPGGYIIPVLAVDNLILRKENEEYKILLITRGHEPSVGKYAFPGGHVNYGEDLETAVLRELMEECNLKGKIPKLFNAYGKPERDERKHVISVIYSVEVEDFSSLKAGDDAATASFVDLKDLVKSPEKFAFDHHNILIDFINSKDELKNYLALY